MSRNSSPTSIGKTTSAVLVALSLAIIAGPAGASGERSALKLLERPVKSDSLLRSLIGKWRGAGIVKQGSNQAKQAMDCRTTNAWAAEKKLLKMSLLCIGEDFRFNAVGYIGRDGRNYRGDWSTFLQSATLTGKRAGNGLVLTLASNSSKSDTSTLRIKLSGKGLTNSLVRRDRDTGKTYTAFTANLSK